MFSRANKTIEKKGWSGASAHGVVSGRRSSLVAANMAIVGDIEGDGELVIDGTVEGNVVAYEVRVGEGAYVNGSIFAEMVYVAGAVEGTIEAMSVMVAASATVIGHITHNSLEIETGATIDGRRPWRPPNFLDGRRPWGEPV